MIIAQFPIELVAAGVGGALARLAPPWAAPLVWASSTILSSKLTHSLSHSLSAKLPRS